MVKSIVTFCSLERMSKASLQRGYICLTSSSSTTAYTASLNARGSVAGRCPIPILSIVHLEIRSMPPVVCIRRCFRTFVFPTWNRLCSSWSTHKGGWRHSSLESLCEVGDVRITLLWSWVLRGILLIYVELVHSS